MYKAGATSNLGVPGIEKHVFGEGTVYVKLYAVYTFPDGVFVCVVHLLHSTLRATAEVLVAFT